MICYYISGKIPTGFPYCIVYLAGFVLLDGLVTLNKICMHNRITRSRYKMILRLYVAPHSKSRILPSCASSSSNRAILCLKINFSLTSFLMLFSSNDTQLALARMMSGESGQGKSECESSKGLPI